MTEVNYILTTLTSRSLIIIDELCRSTSVEEGTAIAMAICEDLARSGAYTYVTTHYRLLTKLADRFFNIKVWQMQTIPLGDPVNPKLMKLDYKFNLIPETTNLRGYGIYMVRNIWLDELLKHVDELQGQLFQTTNDPKFPRIDKRVRLKYDLECKLKKLKLQNKLTIANLNQHINDYNNEIAKLGGISRNSQMLFQDQHASTAREPRDEGLNHSIFDASMKTYTLSPQSEISNIYLDNIHEENNNNNTFHSVEQSEMFLIRPAKYSNSQHVVLNPLSTDHSFQVPITSPSEGEQRMLQVFTPDTNLENFQTQSSYYSIDPNENFEMFVPEVNLSGNTNECSLNLTKDALGLDKDHQSRMGNNVEENTTEFIHPQQEPNTHYLDIESPFTNTFLPPLQGDMTRTSTPLVAKIKHNARNFGTSSTSSSVALANKIQVTTPRISFTILNNVKDIDIQSVQEDLESFVEDMQNGDFDTEEYITKPESQNNKYTETIAQAEDDKQAERNYQQEISKNIYSEKSAYETIQNYKNLHIFPIVNVIQGPNAPSFDEETSSDIDERNIIRPVIRNLQCNQEGDGNVNTLITAFNSLSEPKNRIRCHVAENNDNNNFHQRGSNNQVDCNFGNPVSNQNGNFKAEQLSSPSKNKSSDFKHSNTETDELIEAFNSLSYPRKSSVQDGKITNFIRSKELENKIAIHCNVLLKTGVPQELSDHISQQWYSSYDSFISVDNNNENQDTACESINENRYQKTLGNNFNERHNDSVLEGTEEFSTDYESAISNPYSSNLSLDSPKKALGDGNNSKLIVKAPMDPSQESVYHSTEESKEKHAAVKEPKNNTERSTIKLIEGVDKVIDSNIEKSLGTEDECGTSATAADGGGYEEGLETTSVKSNNSNISNFYKPVESPNTKQTNVSSATDYEKLTEKLSAVSHQSMYQEGTETEKIISTRTFEINNQELSSNKSIQETRTKRKAKLYSDLSAESGSRSNHSVIDISPIKDLGKKYEIVNSNIADFEKNTSASLRKSNLNEMDDKDSKANNEEDLRIASASSASISASDVILTINKDDPKMNKFQIEECEEALKKEKELLKKITEIKEKNEKKDEKNRLSRDKPAQYIPYLSGYSSSSSGYSEKQNKTNFGDNNLSTKPRKVFYRKRTLGISRSSAGPKVLQLKRTSSSKQKAFKKDIAKTKVITETNDENVIRSLENAGDITKKDNSKSDKIPSNTEAMTSENTAYQPIKRRKWSPNEAESASFLVHSTQHRAAEEKTITSLSEASKSRNLDGEFSSSYSGGRKYCLKSGSHNQGGCDKESSDDHKEKTVTSIPEASRQRNLDHSSFSSPDKRQFKNNIEETANQTRANSIDTNESQRKKPKMFTRSVKERSKVAPLETTPNSDGNEANSSKASETITQGQSRPKFVSPSKLSKKAIEEAFYEQDRKFFESSGSSTELAKIWEERLRRPTVRQIQRRTCLATVRKTGGGVEVIPTTKGKQKRRNSQFKGKMLSSSSNSMNMNIFSDKNAETFDLFIKSDKKDYKSFNFNFGNEDDTGKNDGKMFNFQQVAPVPFVFGQTLRKRCSEECASMSQQSSCNLPFLTQNAEFSLTPEGFYKRNKDDVNQLLSKYK